MALGYANACQPKEPLPIDIDFEDWIEGINKMADSFKRIPYSRSFAESLKENIDDKEVVHLVVTATGSYRGAARDEAHDLATELPEIQRALLCLCCLNIP